MIIKNIQSPSEMNQKDISAYIIRKYIILFKTLKNILKKEFLPTLMNIKIETFSDLYFKAYLLCASPLCSKLSVFLKDCLDFLRKNDYLLLIHYFLYTYISPEFSHKKNTKEKDEFFFLSKEPILSDSLLEKINENLIIYLNVKRKNNAYIIKSHIKHVGENDLLKILTKNGIFFSEKEKISLDENVLFKNDEERFSLIKKEIVTLEEYRKKAKEKILQQKKEKKLPQKKKEKNLFPSDSIFSKNEEKKPTCNSKKMIRSTSERNLLDKNIPKINEKPTSSSPKKLTRSTSFNQRRTSLFDFLQKSPRGLKNTSSQLVDKQLALLKALITSKEANPAKSSAIKLHLLRIFQLTNNLHSITNTTLTTDDRNIRQLRNLILYYEYDEKSLQLIANTIINYVNKGSFDFDLMKENLLRNAKKIEKNFTSLSAILYEKYQLFLQLSQNFKSKKNLISAFQTDSNFSWQILGLIVEIVTIYKLLLKNLDLPKEQLFSENLTKLLNEANLDLRNPLCHETEFLLNEKKYEKLAGLVLKLSKKFKDEFVSLSNSSLNTSARWQT